MRLKGWRLGMVSFLVVLAMVLAACGSSGQNDQGTGDQQGAAGSGAQDGSTEKVTVTLTGWGSSPTETELFMKVLDEFEKKHPNIDVKWEPINENYMDVLQTRLVGGQAADVFYLDSSEAPALMSRGLLEPLDGYIKPEDDLADFEENLLNAFRWEGKIYGLPKDYSTLALFYNKKLFAEAGLKEPPKTWDELLEYAEKLTKDTNGDGKPDQWGLAIQHGLDRAGIFIYGNGGEIVDETGKDVRYDEPAAVEGVQWYVDLALKHKVAVRPQDIGAGWTGDAFGKGNIGMVIEGPWAIPFLKDNYPEVEYGVAELPSKDGQNKVTYAFTVAYVMNKQAKNKEAAWQLIRYLTGKEGMKTWTSLGIALPSRKSVAQAHKYDQDPLRKAFIAGAAYARPWQLGLHFSVINNNFNNQMEAVFAGQKSVADALEDAAATAEREIGR